MIVFRIITLLLFVSLINFSFAQSPQNDWDSKFEIVEDYVRKIDTSDNQQFQMIIDEIKKDTNKFSYHGATYSTFEYIITQFFLSGNIITCNRLKFLEKVITLDITFNQKIPTGLLLYAKNDLKGLQILYNETAIDTINGSFLPSLMMSFTILKSEYSDNYDVFMYQVDSIYQQYQQLSGDENSLNLLLPMCDIFMIWHKKFPTIEPSEFYQFINSRKWHKLDGNSLYECTTHIFYYDPPCKSTVFNIDVIKMLNSSVSIYPDRHFYTADFLIEKPTTNMPKKKRCKKRNK